MRTEEYFSMRIVLSAAVWLLAVGMSYLAGDVAFGSDIGNYIENTDISAVYISGGLVIAAVYACWYLLRREDRLMDIAAPVCALLVWGLARRRTLYDGGRGMLYSVAYELRNAYGMRTELTDIDYVSAADMLELVLFITAVIMFFAAYMIYRCDSVMLAVAMPLVLMFGGAALEVEVSPQGVVCCLTAVIICRHITVRAGQPLSPAWDVGIPSVCLAACLIAALLTYQKAYDKGIESQPQVIELADNIGDFVTGQSGRGYSSYYRIDDSDVHPTDEVIDEITRPDKPVGNLYVTTRSYITYADGVWTVRDVGYSADSEAFVGYDREVFAAYAEDIRNVAEGRNVYSIRLMDDVVEFIRAHMEYTTTPDAFAEGTDPVMYALYEGHEGYCIHFAAAAVMAFRSLGIPAKYDIGYVIPSSAWTRQSDGSYHALVLDKYSHAWMEAYDEKEGQWTIVDATPLGDRADMLDIPREPDSYASNGDEPGETGQTGDGQGTGQTSEKADGDTARMTTDETTEDMTEDAAQDVTEEISDVPENTEAETGDTASEAGTEDADVRSVTEQTADDAGESAPWALFALMAAVLLAAGAASAKLRRYVAVKRRRHAFVGSNRIAAIHEMSAELYRMLEFAGVAETPAGDDDEYAQLVTDRCTVLKDDEMTRFVERVRAAVYGGVIPGDEDMAESLRLYRRLALYVYWGLGAKDRFVWKYIRCYDIPRRRK